MRTATRLALAGLCVLALPLGAQAEAGWSRRAGGVVRDSASGAPVAGAQVWIPGTPYGAVTDRRGRFRIDSVPFNGYALVVRVCGQINSLRRQLDAADPLTPRLDLRVPRPAGRPCPPLGRVPWGLTPSDTTLVTGHYIHSWEGSFVERCGGGLYHPWWSPRMRARIGAAWPASLQAPEEGARLFVTLRGRIDGDPTTSGGVWRALFVRELVEVRQLAPGDCRP